VAALACHGEKSSISVVVSWLAGALITETGCSRRASLGRWLAEAYIIANENGSHYKCKKLFAPVLYGRKIGYEGHRDY
jgi:hypothetical protein